MIRSPLPEWHGVCLIVSGRQHMQANRSLILAIMPLSLALIGCSKSAQAPSSDSQSSASQNSGNSAASDNNGANQAATSANSPSNNGTQAVIGGAIRRGCGL